MGISEHQGSFQGCREYAKLGSKVLMSASLVMESGELLNCKDGSLDYVGRLESRSGFEENARCLLVA